MQRHLAKKRAVRPSSRYLLLVGYAVIVGLLAGGITIATAEVSLQDILDVILAEREPLPGEVEQLDQNQDLECRNSDHPR